MINLSFWVNNFPLDKCLIRIMFIVTDVCQIIKSKTDFQRLFKVTEFIREIFKNFLKWKLFCIFAIKFISNGKQKFE